MADEDYRAFAQKQIEAITETLTKVMFGDFTQVARTSSPDETFGYLCAMINVAINAARVSQEELRSKNEDLEEVVDRMRQSNAELLAAQDGLQESETRLQALFEHAPDGYYLSDLKGTFLDGNRRAEELVGFPKEELIGRNFLQLGLLSVTDLPKAAKLLAKNALGIPTGPDEFILTRKDGSRLDVEIRTRPIQMQGRSVVLGLVSDIAARKAAEAALQTSEEKYRLLAESAADVIWTSGLGPSVDYVSPSIERLTGYTPEEALALRLDELNTPESMQTIEALRQEMESLESSKDDPDRTRKLELQLKRKDGSLVWTETNVSVIRDPSGAAVGLQGGMRDISDRVAAEEALRRSEEQYRSLIEELPAPVAVHRHGQVLFMNQAALDFLGYEWEEAKTMATLDFIHPDDHAIVTQPQNALLSAAELRYRKPDGSIVIGEVRELPTTFGGSEARLIVARDVTARRQAGEEARQLREELHDELERRVEDRTRELKESEERYRRIVETTQEGIWILDGDGVVTFANRRMGEMLGYQPAKMVGSPVGQFISERLRKAVQAEIDDRRSGRDGEAEVHLQRKDGSEILTLMSTNPIESDDGEPLGLLGMFVDMSQHRQLEDQLRQSRKMEAIGLLAGGVAHDFNNLLTVINGHSELALMSIGSEHPLSRRLEQVHQAGEQAASLTRQLLAFSRRQMLQPTVLDLNDVVANVKQLLSHTIGEDIELVLWLDPDLHPVKVDRTQMEQVLLNLAVNARDAMPEGGRLTLATTNIELGSTVAEDPSFRTEPGEYSALIVSDTGIGMGRETRERIFDPFFTTKEQLKGTGLGLSTVFGIVKQSGGYIWVESELDHGTSFHVCLPRSEEAVETSAEARTVPDFDGSCNETILLVEDERRVREFALHVLQEKGYRVLEAQHPEEALRVCKGYEDPIDLLLTDIVMPGGTGQELATEILASRPHTRVLYMSGYSAFRSTDLRLDPASPFLAKPFSPGKLTQKVREVLEPG